MAYGNAVNAVSFAALFIFTAATNLYAKRVRGENLINIYSKRGESHEKFKVFRISK
jgi:hypothetical protein